jgi:subtilisin-like proprotein convertase family protein
MKTLKIKQQKIKSVSKLIFGALCLLLIISCSKDDDPAVAATVEPARANSIQIVSGNNQVAFTSQTLESLIELQVNDQNGNAFPGTTISLAVDEGSISSSIVTTDANGRASLTWILGDSIGEQVLTATAFGSDGSALVGSPTSVRAEALNPCQTFSSDEQFPIGPDAGTETRSVITITDEFLIEPGIIINLDLEHTFDGDLDIFLIAPDGRITELSSDNGGSGNNYTNTIFDEQASALVINGIAPFTGAFRPEEPFTLLEGTQAAGDWTLLIIDDQSVDEGTLLSWSLFLCRPQ